jgi:hypothetical protein
MAGFLASVLERRQQAPVSSLSQHRQAREETTAPLTRMVCHTRQNRALKDRFLVAWIWL